MTEALEEQAGQSGYGDGQSTTRPLEGVLVLDLSQFLAGPVAALRLADMGARVIKVERPGSGDIGRRLMFADMEIDGDALSFHAMNRAKESYVADLKDPADLVAVQRLIQLADVLIQNFRPGVIERIGLDYESVRKLNPRLVYGSISGYGTSGPWADMPGQDLLAQALSGLPWLQGHRDQGPVAVGLSIADLLASLHLAFGIVSLLQRRERTGEGGLVETSLLAGLLDLQFELLSAHLTDPSVSVRRGGAYSANAMLAAPYGVYPTADGFIALAMNPVDRLGELIGLAEIAAITDEGQWYADRDRIAEALAEHLQAQPTQHWLEILRPADVWCAPLLSLSELVTSDGFRALRMDQEIRRAGSDGRDVRIQTTRSPIRIDCGVLGDERGAPRLGADTAAIDAEFDLRSARPTGAQRG